jgi:hypothetical protein
MNRPWLRPIVTPSEHRALVELQRIYDHTGSAVRPNQKLCQVIHRRPDGVTADQWNYATHARLDFVVCDA